MPFSAPVDTYLALSSSSPRCEVLAALQDIINTPIDTFSAHEKEQLAQELLDDVKDGNRRVSQKEIAMALAALKTIGRNPSASRIIVEPANLRILLSVVNDSKEQDNESAHEAFRCVANALLLIEGGRDAWLDIQGGDICVDFLGQSSPQSNFLASRILFLTTVKQSPFIRRLIEELHVADILAQRYDSLMGSLLSGQAMAKEAMIDILKFTFNLLIQYPQMLEAAKSATDRESTAQDAWNDSLESLLPPLLRMYNGLPPTFPSPLAQPLTHVIHALINIPVAPLSSRWFSPPPPPRTSPTDKIHRALSALSPGRKSQPSSRSPSPVAPASTPRDTVQHTWDLFELTTAHYFPGDPDDASVRELSKKEGVVLDDTLPPLIILLTRLAEGDGSSKLRMREWILPADLDRTSPLETREDLLGRCIRLMACVYFPRIKDTIGELLFALCDSDASVLAGQIGYGNCAGFLFNRGIMAPPPGATANDGTPLNPITGVRSQERQNPMADMTEEEREREAERLFVLFDRLERSGMGVNPIRRAQQEGRLEEIA